MMKKIAITIGDPAGVGAEILEKWLNIENNYIEDIEIIAHKSFLDSLGNKAISRYEVGPSEYVSEYGNPEAQGAKIAYEALTVSAQGCMEGRYKAVVTLPISKINMKNIGFNYPGQTEFFGEMWNGEPIMAFIGKKLMLSLVTWHEPLRNVYSLIDEDRLGKAVKAINDLTKKIKGIEEPRIAVCGLNPHAGENGVLGGEEKYIINPILEILKVKYKNLSYCLPSDTVFARTLKGEFDCIVAMYHDQGLATLKAIEFDEAVNISANMPYVRTSPDHGTAFDIAGKGIASIESFKNAVDLARKLSL